jgi:hypothetical protein
MLSAGSLFQSEVLLALKVATVMLINISDTTKQAMWLKPEN